MEYHFCPVCGRALQLEHRDHEAVPVCTNAQCRFIFWQNSKPCVSVIIPNEKGELLLTRRAIDPEKDKLDLPGGFLQAGEHPDDGAQRELKEELSVDIEVVDYLGFVIDQYGSNGDSTLNIGISARIIGGTPTPNAELAGIEWLDPATINSTDLAFRNNEKLLKLWQQIDKSESH